MRRFLLLFLLFCLGFGLVFAASDMKVKTKFNIDEINSNLKFNPNLNNSILSKNMNLTNSNKSSNLKKMYILQFNKTLNPDMLEKFLILHI